MFIFALIFFYLVYNSLIQVKGEEIDAQTAKIISPQIIAYIILL